MFTGHMTFINKFKLDDRRMQALMSVLTTIVFLFSFLVTDVQASDPLKIADKKQLSTQILLDLFNAEFSQSDNTEGYVSQHRINISGAGLIKPHFSQFNIPDGAYVTVSNADGTELYRYGKNNKDGFTYDTAQGDDGEFVFSSMSITGDTAIIKLYIPDVNNWKNEHGIIIDSYLEGYPSERIEELMFFAESTCGSVQRRDAVCYKTSHPAEFTRAAAVAKFFTGEGTVCTAWRVGDENRMMTNNHCQDSNSGIRSSESWFNYQRISCNGSKNEPDIIKVSGKEMLKTNRILDYTLFTVNNFSRLGSFGNLGLDVRTPVAQEEIYIPEHGSGNPKELAIESDQNAGNVCRIDQPTVDGKGSKTDTGYKCDTTGGSSGSPVLARNSHRVIALHHLGGCPNKGAQITQIWPQVSQFFPNGIPPGSENSPPAGNTAPVFNSNPISKAAAVQDQAYSGTVAGDASDAEGNVLTFSKDSGPGWLAIASNGILSGTPDSSDVGANSFSIRVSDGEFNDQATLNITVNETAPRLPTVTVIASDASASEAGLDPGTLTFSRTGDTKTTLNLRYSIGGTATNGKDYKKKSGIVKIRSGKTSRTITIKPVNDSTVESDETVIVTISPNAAYQLGASGDATVIISDDDTGSGANPPVVTLSFVQHAREAGRKHGRVRLQRTGKTNRGLTVQYSVAGTALSGTDYKVLTGSKKIKARKSKITFDIVPVNDTLAEGLENVVLTVQPDAAYQVGAADSATVNIIDND